MSFTAAGRVSGSRSVRIGGHDYLLAHARAATVADAEFVVAGALPGFDGERLQVTLTPTYTGYADYDPFGDNGVGALLKTTSLGSNYGYAMQTRTSNSVSYFTPSSSSAVVTRPAMSASRVSIGWSASSTSVTSRPRAANASATSTPM